MKGRGFVIDGVEVDLFPPMALLAVLERKHQCLYTWEHHHGFPASMWRVRDHKTINRWYSKKQLIAIHVIAKTFNWLKGKDRNKLPAFIKAIREVFFRVDLPTNQRTT